MSNRHSKKVPSLGLIWRLSLTTKQWMLLVLCPDPLTRTAHPALSCESCYRLPASSASPENPPQMVGAKFLQNYHQPCCTPICPSLWGDLQTGWVGCYRVQQTNLFSSRDKDKDSAAVWFILRAPLCIRPVLTSSVILVLPDLSQALLLGEPKHIYLPVYVLKEREVINICCMEY